MGRKDALSIEQHHSWLITFGPTALRVKKNQIAFTLLVSAKLNNKEEKSFWDVQMALNWFKGILPVLDLFI